MIDIQTIVRFFVTLLIIGAVFGIMFAILYFIAKECAGNEMVVWMCRIIRIVLFVLLGLVLIGLLLSYAVPSNAPLIRT